MQALQFNADLISGNKCFRLPGDLWSLTDGQWYVHTWGLKRGIMCAGIDEGLQALKEGGVPPRLLIVDDGWQSTDLDPALRPLSTPEALQSEHEVSWHQYSAGHIHASCQQ